MKKFFELPFMLKVVTVFFLILSCWGLFALTANTFISPLRTDMNLFFAFGYKVGYFFSRLTQYVLFLILIYEILNKRKWVIKFSIVAFLYSLIFDGYFIAEEISEKVQLPITAQILIKSYVVMFVIYCIWFYIISRKVYRERFYQ